MKAPDKIYVSIGPRQSLIARAGRTLNSDIEFIRKDALLEWAKEKYKYYESLYSVTDDPVNWGQRNMCQQLIDKLNSM